MRILLHLSPSPSIVPYNYQPLLVGTLHKWIKWNNLHGDLSLYSFSWLRGGDADDNGLKFRNYGEWFINCHDKQLLKKIIQGIQKDPTLFYGLKVDSVDIIEDPEFGNLHKFHVGSPVFIKHRVENSTKFYYYNDETSDNLLTNTLKHKLRKVGLDDQQVSVRFDRTHSNPVIKGATYNGVFNKGSICPVIIEGTPNQIAFAWNVGVGSSTGIGCGSLI